MSGGCVCIATGLTRKGREEMAVTDIPNKVQIVEGVLLVELFAGLGGLALAGKLAGLPILGIFVMEIEKFARKVALQGSPNSVIATDVLEVALQDIRRLAYTFLGVIGVIIASGSPCQDVSGLYFAAGVVTGTRSRLYLQSIRIRQMVLQVFFAYPVRTIWENVASMSPESRMTWDYGLPVYWNCASGCSHARRPRLWTDVELKASEGVHLSTREDYQMLDLVAGKGCRDRALPQGWR